MPPVRTMPAAKPLRTERTHEENQERAYIAASRRSDRSLEARVESARRASEIHKKRTGRSLRVREEDVMNEEMYEEEDDDLPMQYRRINALNPHLSYAFAERLNNYVNGQIGVRTALQQAIAQSNQYQQNQQLLNQYMQQNGCYPNTPATPGISGYPQQSPWPMQNAQHMQGRAHNRSASFAAPHAGQTHSAPNSAITPGVDMRRMSLPVRNPIHAPGSMGVAPQDTSSSPRQIPSPPQSISTPRQQAATASPIHSKKYIMHDVDTQIAPLTTKLPNETLQMIHGTNSFTPSFFAHDNVSGSPPMAKYSYNPNGNKTSSRGSTTTSEKGNPFEGLNQTLSPNVLTAFPQFHEPMSAISAPGNLDSGFDANAYPSFSGLAGGDYFADPMELGNDGNTGDAHNSGFVTPSDNLDVTFGDFFDFQPTPE